MGRAKRIGFTKKQYCKCVHASDGDKRLSKRKQEFLRKIRTGVQERFRTKPLKIIKQVHTVKKKTGHQPVKHYVNLPGWVVRNLIDLCKKKAKTRNKSKSKIPPRRTPSMESVKEKPPQKFGKNMENEQVPGEVMEIKREMATT